jgi:hypothetical protein
LHLHDDALVGHQVVRALVVHFEEEVVGATGDVGSECEMELDRLPASGRQGGGGPIGLYGKVTAFFGYLRSMLSII